MTEARPEAWGELGALLDRAALGTSGENIADALWLSQYVTVQPAPSIKAPVQPPPDRSLEQPSMSPPPRREPLEPEEPAVDVVPQESGQQDWDASRSGSKGHPFQAPAAKALREARALGRALRPLKRKVNSSRVQVLDEVATAERTAERRVCVPVMQAAPERWLEVVLVIEEAPSMFLWERTLREFVRLLERQGAFRDVRVWSLRGTEDGQLFQLYAQRHWGKVRGTAQSRSQGRPRSPKELIDPAGRRLILLASDCTSLLWRSGQIVQLLKMWGREGLFSILQLLPERLWRRTTLSFGSLARLSALLPGVPNEKLRAEPLVWLEAEEEDLLRLPVVTLEPESMAQWAGVLAGFGACRMVGVLVEVQDFLAAAAALGPISPGAVAGSPRDLTEEEALERVRQFQLGASSGIVNRLAGYMAAVPVSPPITDLIRETLLPGATQADVAEVYMSGLMRRAEGGPDGKEPWRRYEFIPAVRRVLVKETVLVSETEAVLDAVTAYLVARLGRSVSSFLALLVLLEGEGEAVLDGEVRAFARFGMETLRQVGGRYGQIAEAYEGLLGGRSGQPKDLEDWPLLEDFEFPVAKIVFEDEERSQASSDGLERFEFETVQVDRRGKIVSRETRQAWQFVEDLGDGVGLEMVAVPGGSFVMGSPGNEKERANNEGPQREVKVPDFFLGKYSVTQAQWRRVAQLPRVERDLQPEPSQFKGDNRPVERVSWYEAQEFCARLSRATGRTYRLPSEAEWEYACRAGTETPFYFGETITPELANYDGNYTYGGGPKGKYREETTDVGSFYANAFGLYDMHGNVYDWCEDHFHNSYEGAPKDGSAWIDSELNKEKSERSRVLRGGSWIDGPRYCRSAYRGYASPDDRNLNYGVRVVCVSARTHFELYTS